LGEYGNQGQVNREYIYWEEMPGAFIQDGKMFYYHYDPMEFPVLISNERGNVVRKVDYKPSGEIISIYGNHQSISNDLLFPGQFEIAETQLFYNYYRTFDPSNGTYLEPDPYFINQNIYSYAISNSVLFKDEKGQYPKKHKYFAKKLGTGGAGEIGGFMAVSGYACSECFERNGEYLMSCGLFRAAFSGFTVGLPISFANIKLGKSFKSIQPILDFPTIREFDGKSSIATGGGALIIGFGLGHMKLGNVENKGFSLTLPALDFSLFIGKGYCWVLSDHEDCCGGGSK
jgi:RHS repeat-associated protein